MQWPIWRSIVSRNTLQGFGLATLSQNKRMIHKDPYQTRGSQDATVPRADPVVWPDHQGNWKEGYLSTEQLNNYNTKGYVILDKVFSGRELEQMQQVADITHREYHAVLKDNANMRINHESRMVTEQEGRKVSKLTA